MAIHKALGRVVLVLPLLCWSVFAQERLTSAMVDRYINAQMQKYGIPGLSLAVVKNGAVLHLNSPIVAVAGYRLEGYIPESHIGCVR